MGVKLSGIPSRPAERADLDGKIVAIDAPNLMYAFYAVQLLRQEPTPEAREAALQAATKGLATRIADLARLGARSVAVFDGPPHERKLAHLEARDAARSTPPIAPREYGRARDAARAMGAPVVDAPHDAEAQASAMARRGLVDIVATTDWDAMAMGAPTLLRNLSANPQAAEGSRRWAIVEARSAFDHLGADARALAGAAVLMGCDYDPGFDGIGPSKAFRLLATHGTLEKALGALGADAARREAALEAHRLLTDPPHVEVTLRWGLHDSEALLRALHGPEARPRASVQTRLG
jgi:flap endonuclease-1